MNSHDDDDRYSDGPVYNLEETLNAPRKKHGTRVVITFVCSGCNKDSTLDYKPKGVPLTEMLCETCMKARGDSPRWEIVREKKAMEQKSREWRWKCVDCGHEEIKSRPPNRKRPWVCQRCMEDQEQPNHARLEGAEPLSEDQDGPLVRRKISED